MKRIFINTRSVIIAITFLINSVSLAGNEWIEFYNNSRSLAMGGAGIAITSDDTSIFRNPANLGSLRDFYGTIIDPELEGTGNLTATDIDIAAVMKTLGTKPDVYYRQKSQVSPVLVRRNIGFGLIYKSEISAEMPSAAPATMDTTYKNDVGAVIGSNLRLFDGRIKIGAVMRAFNRIEVVNSSLSTAGPTDLQTIGSEGTAYAVDAGLLMQAPWTMIPTLGLVLRDIGNTTFIKDGVRISSAARPNTIPQSLDAAISLFPIHSNLLRSVWTLEYSDLTNSRNDTDSSKRMHFGIEFNSRDIFFFRLGYNQRYYTAGFEIASEHMAWQVSTYGEEVGTSAMPREDRRVNSKLSIRF